VSEDSDSEAGREKTRSRAVPTGRTGRALRVAGLAGRVAGSMLAEGTRQWRAGKRPRKRDLLLTPGNARRVADQLSEMRGAAMKLGQILSMDNGEFLPRELADILARLRSEATAMPEAQLEAALRSAYGRQWRREFAEFDPNPIAAASIGQVHRALSHEGEELALKIQYPGIADSIDSDIDNIAYVLRVANVLPAHVDVGPLLEDAKRQLKDEADYLLEAGYLEDFHRVLGDDERFVLPRLHRELTRGNVLAMSYESGGPMESLARKPRAERDRVMSALVGLMVTELFDLHMVQTDPNFANYQYRYASGEIVLLDFGATRRFDEGFVDSYRELAGAAIDGDKDAMAEAAEKVGYAVGDEDGEYRALLLELLLLVLEPLRHEGPYDFGASDMPARLAALAQEAATYADFWHAPPTDVVYFHRKVGGMFLLANRMDARVDANALMVERL
jgi:predicted unusual protein kinase regulating ubiquinone biosynthesis (AarF/ABC1/UbiB family)